MKWIILILVSLNLFVGLSLTGCEEPINPCVKKCLDNAKAEVYKHAETLCINLPERQKRQCIDKIVSKMLTDNNIKRIVNLCEMRCKAEGEM